MEVKAPYSEESRGDMTSSPLTEERLRIFKSSDASFSEQETAFIFQKKFSNAEIELTPIKILANLYITK